MMSAVSTEKWVLEVTATDRIGDAAARTLPGRLGAVLYYLPLAAEKSHEDSEHIHQLRVWTRRATAALGLYEELLPRRRCLWMLRQLKRIRRAANDARDCDVLVERIKKMPLTWARQRWHAAVLAARAEAQMAVVAVHERLRRDNRFARRIDQFLERVRRRGDEMTSSEAVPFGEWARAHFTPVVERFFAAVPADQMSDVALHQFRLCSKRLRYEMELVAGAFSEEFRTRHYSSIQAMQDRLGEINDLATAKAFLQDKIDAASDQSESACWRRLLIKEQEALDRACQQFWEWCTPQTLQELCNGFEKLLGNPSPLERHVDWTPSAPIQAPIDRLMTQNSSAEEQAKSSFIDRVLPT